MIICIQGLRDATGSSFLAANLAEILAEHESVALISTKPAPGTFETYWGLGPFSPKSWMRAIGESLPIENAIERANTGFPVLFPFGLLDALTTDVVHARALSLLTHIEPYRFSTILIDAGDVHNPWSQAFRQRAHRVITVIEPDHDALIRLMSYQPLESEVFVLNKVIPGSAVGFRLTSFLETDERFAHRLIRPVLPYDEAAVESGFLMTRVVKSAPESAISHALRTLKTTLVAEGLVSNQDATPHPTRGTNHP